MESGEDVPIDYVFRVVSKANHEEFREFLSKFQVNHLRNKLYSVTSQSILELGRTSPRRSHLSSSSTNESSDSSNKSFSLDTNAPDSPLVVRVNKNATSSNLAIFSNFSVLLIFGFLVAIDQHESIGKHCFGVLNDA